MNDINVRKMGPDDLDTVALIEEQSFTTPWSRAALESEIQDNTLAHYLVAEVENAVVGYAGMWMILDEGHITNVAVLPSFRGKGIGKIIMKKLMEHAKAHGASCMTLEVRESNLEAKRLYENLGFVPRGLRRQYYTDTQEDAVIMWCDRL